MPVDDAPRVIAHRLESDGEIPNNPACALLAYPGAVDLPDGDPASAFEALFEANGWTGGWRNGIFPFHHYHSNAHEVLGIFSGSADVLLGGENGVVLTVRPGDVVIVPAGVGHKKLRESGGLGVVGAYPAGQSPDLCRRAAAHDRSARNVAAVPLPARDPVFGAGGPLFEHWSAAPR